MEKINYNDSDLKELEQLKNNAKIYDEAKQKSAKRNRVIVIAVFFVSLLVFLYLRVFNTHFEMVDDNGIRVKYSTAWFINVPAEYEGKKIEYAEKIWEPVEAPYLLFLTFEEGIQRVGGSNSNTLMAVQFPSTITDIHDDAFYKAKNLRWVSLPNQVDSLEIGKWAFQGTAIREIILPEGVTGVGKGAFYGCDNLEKAEFPDTVTYMGEGMFAYCGKLKMVKLPNSYEVLPDRFFEDCYGLKEVIWPSDLKAIFYSTWNASEILPEGVHDLIPEGVIFEKKKDN